MSTVSAALNREFRVTWYETYGPRKCIVNGKSKPLRKTPPKQKTVFSIKARTLDVAKKRAREHVEHSGGKVLTVNFTEQGNGLTVYTREEAS